VLGVDVEEKSTGELQLSAGFSSLERFLVNLSIRQRNFMGKGQELRAGVNYSSYSKSVELGFTEPYLFDRNIAVGADLYRRDFRSFNFTGGDRNTTYEQVTTGGQLRAGVPLTEYLQLALRYGLNLDEITLDGQLSSAIRTARAAAAAVRSAARRPLSVRRDRRAHRVLDRLFARLQHAQQQPSPDARQRVVLSQDFAGLGGDVRICAPALNAAKYWNVGSGFIFSTSGEGGYIHSFEDRPAPASIRSG
jgi:outer membrane protein insertion porin family